MGAFDPVSWWPIAVYTACVAVVVSVMIGLSLVLGQRRRDRATGRPYESGIVAHGTARVRMTSQFYLMAMLFVIFDLEAVFIFAWAVSARDLGWVGFSAILIFILLLLLALVYLLRTGALSWGPAVRTSRTEPSTTGGEGS